MQKTVAILQSNYIPWKGYFDIINAVDEFVIYDDCQFTRRDWRNRNKIKTPQGDSWLTVPVRSKGRYNAPIRSIEVDGQAWIDKHVSALKHHYGKSAGFKELWPIILELYNACRREMFLSELNYMFIKKICSLLRIDTPLIWSHEFNLRSDDPTERLVDICELRGADAYLSGPAAHSYLDEKVFSRRGISVLWMRYDQYPEYPQQHPPFRHDITVLDVLFNTGLANARELVCRFVPSVTQE